MAKAVKKAAKQPRVEIPALVSITDVEPNGDGTYNVSGFVRPAQAINLEVFDADGNELYNAPANAGGGVAWSVDELELTADPETEPLCFVAWIAGSTSTYLCEEDLFIDPPFPPPVFTKKPPKKPKPGKK